MHPVISVPERVLGVPLVGSPELLGEVCKAMRRVVLEVHSLAD
jgi:hypothetical protein